MENNISKRYRRALFLADMLVCILSVFTTYLIKYKVNDDVFVAHEFFRNLGIMLILSAILFFALKTYNGVVETTVWRFSVRVVIAVFIISLLFFVLNRVMLSYSRFLPLITWKTLFVNAVAVSVLLIVYRIIFRYILSVLKTLDRLIKG